MNELIIVRGLPGSGKSTFARKNFGLHKKFCIVEADMFHIVGAEYKYDSKNNRYAHQWCQAETARILHTGIIPVVANTFTTFQELYPYIEIAKHFDACITIYECRGDYKSIHDVPEEVIEQMRARFAAFDGFGLLAEDMGVPTITHMYV